MGYRKVSPVTSDGTEILLSNVISTGNSSVTPLDANITFTGAWEDMSQYSAIAISVLSDQASATDGLKLQWSTDGTNVIHTQVDNVVANVDTTRQAMLEAQYFRIVYVNGTTDQTSFTLQVIYMKTPSLGEIQQLGVNVDDTGDAQLTRSVLTAKQPSGAYTNIGATTGGNIKVSIEEYDQAADNIRTDFEGLGLATVGTTAAELAFTGTTRIITITADDTNLGYIYIGKSNVTSAGANAIKVLAAGDSFDIDYDDVTNPIYVVGSIAAQGYVSGAII